MLLLIFLLATVSAQTSEKPIQYFVEPGVNLTLPYCRFTECKGDVVWYRETAPRPHIKTTAQKLCNITSDSVSQQIDPFLSFNCNNNNLNLYNLKTLDTRVYYVNIKDEYTTYNTFYEVNVIYIIQPNCVINTLELITQLPGVSQLAGQSYCLIEINCADSLYPNTVRYNNRENTYFIREKGGNNTLPNYYEVFYKFGNIEKSFKFNYNFSDLCHPIQSLEYNEVDENIALNVFLILIIIISVLVIVGSLILLYCHRRKTQTKTQNKPVLIRLQK
ncbi:CR1-beta [Simian adenovirus 17]|uniref:CR1-beta n=1 Tax=Simian adenovirus 17 TaxID=1715779 RepID=A0A2H4CK38_9ADEN|nr:CR1-beta [Simian adenovirus 17]